MARDQDVFNRTVAEAIRQAKLLFAPRAGNQSSTGNASSTQAGLVPPCPNDATKFLNGAAPPAFAQVKDSDLSLSDIATNNVSAAKHGFAPKLPNDATKYLDGTGAYSVPPGSGGSEPAFPTLSIAPFVRLSARHSVLTKAQGLITGVTDLSGNGKNATSSAGLQPRYVAKLFNGFAPGIWFDGTARLLIASLGAINAPWSVVTVHQFLEINAGDGNMYRDDVPQSTGYHPAGPAFGLFAGSAFTSNTLWNQMRTTVPRTTSDSTPTIRIDVANGASSVLANNGVEVTGNAGSNQLTSSSSTLYLGGLKAALGASNVKMLLYEFLIFKGALTAGDRTALNTYYSDPTTAGIEL